MSRSFSVRVLFSDGSTGDGMAVYVSDDRTFCTGSETEYTDEEGIAWFDVDWSSPGSIPISIYVGGSQVAEVGMDDGDHFTVEHPG